MIQSFISRYKVHFIIFLILIATPLIGIADCQVTLQWDCNNPAPEGYAVYGREENQSYDYDNPWWQGDYTFAQCTVDSLDENKTYYFVVRAFVDDTESSDSNEVRFAASSDTSDTSDTSSGETSDTSSLSSGAAGGSSSSGPIAGCFIESLGME